MVEVAEIHHPFDTEDEEIDEAAAPWALTRAPAPPFDQEVPHHRGDHSFHLGAGRGVPSLGSDVFVPVFCPRIYCFPYDHPDHQITWDFGSDSSDVDDPVSLDLEVFERTSPAHESGGDGGTETEPSSDPVDPLCIGVLDGVEDMGSDYLELGLGLGFGPERPEDEEGGGGETFQEDEGLNLCVDGFFVGGSSLVSGGAQGEPSGSREGKGLRIVGLGSDSDSGEEDEIASMMRPDSDSGDVQDRMFDDIGPPLCWDCLRIEEDRRDQNEDFDWEEVEARVNGREILGTVMDSENSSMVQEEEEANTDLELEEVDEETAHNVEWEVLLAVSNVDRSASVENEDAESYLGEENSDYVYNSEYEVLFEQFADQENFIKGSPPAAKLVIEHLPSVVLTQLDVANDNMICAVCKDEFAMEEKAKQLPCFHHYHAECILPWLRIRNTCPVCRYELPTDDPNYENWRALRAESGGAVQDSQLRYGLEIFPGEQRTWQQ